MAVIELVNVIPGAIGGSAYTTAGAPTAGTDEVQTLTIGGTPDGGTFKLAYDGQITADIDWTATDATLVADVDAALEALSTIGTSGITAADGTLTSGIGTITLTFVGVNAKKNMNLITVYENALTGTAPTLAVATTTPGVDASGRDAARGALLTDTTNGKLYITTTTNPPTWVVVGSQS
jgi:hypothetical protein